MAANKVALRADFQQFYGLNIDEIGTAYTVTHAADLACELPAESRIVQRLAERRLAEEPANVRGQAKPRRNDATPDSIALDIDECRRVLDMARREVAHGR